MSVLNRPAPNHAMPAGSIPMPGGRPGRAAMLVLCLCGMPLAAQIAPASSPAAGANLPAQPVEVADLLEINVYGAPELTRAVRVAPDGSIRLPMLKQSIPVVDRMPAEIEERVAAALAGEQILVDPVVTVTIAAYASRPVSVVGAVGRPLTFETHGPISLLDALARAEGLSPDAGGEILITRRVPGQAQPLTRSVSIRDLLEANEPAASILLEGGEEVRVPEVGRVFVVGNVTRPGAFPVAEASGMTVLKALALAEGLAPFATKDAYIYRPVDGGGKQELKVELRQIMDRKAGDVLLAAGDILYIPDNRRGRVASNVLDKIVSFAAGTASGALILSLGR